MKKLALLILIFSLTACSPSKVQLEKAIAAAETQTQAVILTTTHTPTPTLTPTPGLSLEQMKLLADLKQDLDQTNQEIDNATKDDAQYTSGLIKSLIRMQLETLKINKALVEQRILTLETGAPMTIVVNATSPDPVKAEELANEIETQKAKIESTRAEANKYSGGLIQALALSTLATEEDTLAMLEQQYYIAKYGLSMPTLPTATP